MSAQRMEETDKAASPVEQPVNEVHLVGRLGGEPVARELPSGDTVWTLQVKVARPAGHGTKQTVDALECAVWNPSLARRMAKWRKDDVVEVEGALRRRFYRPAAGGLGSRTEVEVSRGKLIRRAGSG